MSPNSLKNSQGVTLVEVLLSLVVLLIVMLGLMQTALLSIETNTTTQLRDEAVGIASMQISEAKNMPFDDLIDDAAAATLNLPSCVGRSAPGAGPYVLNARPVRNMTVNYGTRRIVTDLCSPAPCTADTKEVKILVRWEFRNECFENSVTTLRRR